MVGALAVKGNMAGRGLEGDLAVKLPAVAGRTVGYRPLTSGWCLWSFLHLFWSNLDICTELVMNLVGFSAGMGVPSSPRVFKPYWH